MNLECPLIGKVTPISKCGPIFGADNQCIKGLKNAKITLLNLANNHILDHGPQGLENTLKVCADFEISGLQGTHCKTCKG